MSSSSDDNRYENFVLDLIADEVENDDDDNDEPEVAKGKEAKEERERGGGQGARARGRRHHETREMSERRDSRSTPRALGVATESSGQATKRRRREQTEMPELPDELWAKILESVPRESKAAFAMTCKQMRRVQEEKEDEYLTTTLRDYRAEAAPDGNDEVYVDDPPAVSAAWFRWAWSLTTDYDDVKRAHYGPYMRMFSVRQVLLNMAAYWGFLTELEGQSGICGAPSGEDICHCAVQGNQIETLIWARQHGCPWEPPSSTRKPWDPTCCCIAAWKGHLDMLKYLHENGCPWNKWTCRRAAWKGHLDALKYLHENGCPWDKWTSARAAQYGNLGVLKYLHENGCPWGEGICLVAAGAGHLDMLKYAHENGCPWNEWTCRGAASNGHLDTLKYAHQNSCPWNEEACHDAAEWGRLNVLKYLHENGCPWNEMTCDKAAAGGHLDVLKYLRENGCPWNEETCAFAAGGGSS